MIRVRIDVDYPYRSRFRSFIYTAFGIRFGSDYLRNSKIIAAMINESAAEVKAHWFFTLKTLPDQELLKLLVPSTHEVDLHVVNNPVKELELLEKTTKRIPSHYTIHGTARLAGRIAWKRFRFKAPKIPSDFRLRSFHDLPTTGIDSLAYAKPPGKAFEIARERLEAGDVIYFHPIWLFQRGKINRRGPCYQVLRRILGVENETETIILSKTFLFTLARDYREYEKDLIPTNKLVARLSDLGADIFTFLERTWLNTIQSPSREWTASEDNIALYNVTTYERWLEEIGKKTRNMIRKAQKNGVRTLVVEPDEKLIEGIWKIYNETPIRQGRGFPHFGESLETVRKAVNMVPNATYVGAYVDDDLAGFLRLIHGNNLTYIDQILSLVKHMDKAVNNALIASAIEACANNNIRWVMYGRIGNHPTLDVFKKSNGFFKCKLRRFYVPLTEKGKAVLAFHLQRELKDTLPTWMKTPLFPIYGWMSRTKIRLRSVRKTAEKTSNPMITTEYSA